ncbi:MAG: alpha-E domain-containing protein, partial [Pseudomonadota bacterium]
SSIRARAAASKIRGCCRSSPMLSRTAENLYWLGRYSERAESTARLIEMGRRMAMLPSVTDDDEWRSVLIAAGARSPADGSEKLTERDIIRILLLDGAEPYAIRACLSRARANGRAIRTALTQDMWEALNEGWRKLELIDEDQACRELTQLLEWVKLRTSTLRGASETGMLRNDGYHFLRLGGYVERADMMLRLLDVKYYVLLPETETVGGGRDHHQWTSVLHANSAVRAYHHLYLGDYTPWQISDFLILNCDFPRSIAYSYRQISAHLAALAERYDDEPECVTIADEMTARLADLEMGEIFQMGLHEFVQDTLRTNNRLSQEIASAYYF